MVPDAEWWDSSILTNPAAGYEHVGPDGAPPGTAAEDKITIYVEHPVPIEPPSEVFSHLSVLVIILLAIDYMDDCVCKAQPSPTHEENCVVWR